MGLLRIDGGVCTPAGGSEQAGGASCCEQRTTGGGAWRRGRDPPNACGATRIATRGASCGWDVGGTEAAPGSAAPSAPASKVVAQVTESAALRAKNAAQEAETAVLRDKNAAHEAETAALRAKNTAYEAETAALQKKVAELEKLTAVEVTDAETGAVFPGFEREKCTLMGVDGRLSLEWAGAALQALTGKLAQVLHTAGVMP